MIGLISAAPARALIGRDLAILRAVATGRAELAAGAMPVLLLDGRFCCDQPIDWYLGRDDRGVLEGTCYSPDAPARDCEMCAGTGGELGDPNAEWDCDSCAGTGRTTDHQPDLPTAIERALADYRGSQGDHDSPTRWALDCIQQTTSHARVETWLADGTVDAETAAAYHAVLIASHDDLAAAAASADRPAAVSLVITSGRSEQR